MTNTDQILNPMGQPIGFPLPNWRVPPPPPREPMYGRFCRIEPLDPDRHAEALFAALALDSDGRTWTYLPYGPFEDFQAFRQWMVGSCLGSDPLFYSIVGATSATLLGMASYLRISPPDGTIEVGHLIFSPRLQRTAAATEAMYLMMKRAFELGYRRYEWKCDSLNSKSRAAAKRLGFSFEGVFRQDRVYKGRTRDTAWFSVIDPEWPVLEKAFGQWLDPTNFDAEGIQRTSLRSLTAALRGEDDSRE